MTSANGAVFSNNVIEDVEGTAVWAGLNGGTINNFTAFGNTISHTAAYAADTGRASGHNYGIAGIVYIANDASNNNTGNNFLVYNNTMYGIRGTYSGVVIQAGSNNVVQNNIWFNSVRTNNSFSGTLSYNWYYNTTADGDSSASKVVCTSNCNVFVDAANRDLRLAIATASGNSLPSPFNVDLNGKVRGADGTWDRGAYEFGGSQTTAPAPATNVRVVR